MAAIVCWSAKGGSGTTVVAAALALSSPAPALLVDLAGDVPAVIGIAEPSGQGVADWLASGAPPDALTDLAVAVDDTTAVIPRGAGPIDRDDVRWAELASWLAARPGCTVVDAGTGEPPPALVETARSLLVTRACYVGLRRAVVMSTRPDGVVLVVEPGRALRTADVQRAIGTPVVATVSVDPLVARAVDAGLLAARLPRAMGRELRDLIVDEGPAVSWPIVDRPRPRLLQRSGVRG